jgi:hypothetical protein
MLAVGRQNFSSFLCLTTYHAMKTYWGSGGIPLHIPNFDTTWRWVVNFMYRPLYPWGKGPGTRWIESWVGPRAGVDSVMKRKKSLPCCRESNPPPKQDKWKCQGGGLACDFENHEHHVSGSCNSPGFSYDTQLVLSTMGTRTNSFQCGEDGQSLMPANRGLSAVSL